MKRRLSARLTGGLSLLAFASALGCEAQVNDEYSGEPLLSLRGNVLISQAQADSDLVPRIAFHEVEWEANTVVMIDGELSGEFPAKFRFDVTQPPPDRALNEPNSALGITSKYAFGFLVMRPSNADSRITARLSTEDLGEQCTDDGSSCTRRERQCDDAGRCRERAVECTQHPCELLEQIGDSDLGVEIEEEAMSHCDSGSCYALESACDAEGKCRTDVYRCELPNHGEWDTIDDGVMTACIAQPDSGDTSLVEFDDLQTVAVGYGIIYVTDDSPDTMYGPLKRGYNLVAATGSNEAYLESSKCEIASLEAAVAEYNTQHGTEYTRLRGDAEMTPLRIAAIKECGFIEVIERPMDEPLTIELGNARTELF